MLIMILGTYANLYAMENSSEQQVQVQNSKLLASQIINGLSNEEIFAEQNQLKQPDNVLNENGKALLLLYTFISFTSYEFYFILIYFFFIHRKR